MTIKARTDQTRAKIIRGGSAGSGPVVYWMSRDQRVRDNWALLHAQGLALDWKKPLIVVFCLAPSFLGATLRQYSFMLRGLSHIENDLAELGIPFVLIEGRPEQTLPAFAAEHAISGIVADFDPLRIKQKWLRTVAGAITVPLHLVDAHNIIPCWVASQRQEYAAYTIRPKIKRLLPAYLTDFPRLRRQIQATPIGAAATDWAAVLRRLRLDKSVSEVTWLKPGEQAARRSLRIFIKEQLPWYAERRNNPIAEGQSGLSPWLHFGHLSAQRVALAVMQSSAPKAAREAFLEELIIRRELSDNFCLYNDDYDNTRGFPAWARRTLAKHASDPREYEYTPEVFENAQTHDELWNAAQAEMVIRGKMHGYLRMYWAKKLLEWSASPEEAVATAVRLNDRYELDGRDPNGYAGIAWSIGGLHDRPWGERRVFGMVRYMSYSGCRSKFDVARYIDYVSSLRTPT